jgi:hypothetical protein
MRKIVVNLLICLVALPFVYAAASFLRTAWFEAFVAKRTSTEHFGFLAGDSVLIWLFYLIFFFAIGVGLPALLRTNRPIVWAVCFSLVYSLFRLVMGTSHFSHPSAYIYVRLVGEYTMPMLGCAVGALLGRRLRGMAPNNSFKPKPLRGSA